MKKRLRKTGEIVDVISYSGLGSASSRCNIDCVSYIDSKGEEHFNVEGLNIYWDFEDVEENLNTDIDWEQRRYELAKEYSKELVRLQHNKGRTETGYLIPDVVKWSVELADALIEELKKTM